VIETLIFIVVVIVIAGVLAWLIQSAPFIEGMLKQIGVWAICAVAVIIIIMKLAGLAGVS
jgi:hypothetical protein